MRHSINQKWLNIFNISFFMGKIVAGDGLSIRLKKHPLLQPWLNAVMPLL
jgi:hypothetical protein